MPDKPASTSTTAEKATTPTGKEPATTTTEGKVTTTTAAPTTATLASDAIRSDASDMPWIALGAVALLVLVVALRSRSKRGEWWMRADALVHNGRSVVDLGSAGPAGGLPQQEIAHWGTPEQIQYADAESTQRLAIVRATLDQLDQLVAPHRASA